jgi:hypothetical protein
MKPAIVEMATSPCAGNDKPVAHEAGLRGGHLGVIAQTIKGFLAVARRCAGRREAIFGAYRKLTGTHASEGDDAVVGTAEAAACGGKCGMTVPVAVATGHANTFTRK